MAFRIALECSFPLIAFESKQKYLLTMISTKQRQMHLVPCANWLSEVNFDREKWVATAQQDFVVRSLQVVRWNLLHIVGPSWTEAAQTGCGLYIQKDTWLTAALQNWAKQAYYEERTAAALGRRLTGKTPVEGSLSFLLHKRGSIF